LLSAVYLATFGNRSYNSLPSNMWVVLTRAGWCVFVWSTIWHTESEELYFTR